MNVALPALVVFILLLPGFIARSRIKLAERLSLDYSPFGQVVSEAVVWAFGLHAAWIAASTVIARRSLRVDIALEIMSTDSAAQGRAIRTIADQSFSIALYFATLIAFAYLGPKAVRWLITRHRLDRLDSPFGGLMRFSGAPWYYLLSGSDFRKGEAPDVISISAIVSVSGVPTLYTGVLDDYFLDQDGRLDRLILQKVMRRPLEKDKGSQSDALENDVSRVYMIEGDYFVLRYDEALTLNVAYIRLAGGEASPSEAALQD